MAKVIRSIPIELTRSTNHGDDGFMGRGARSNARWIVGLVFLGLLGCKQEPAARSESAQSGSVRAPPPATAPPSSSAATVQPNGAGSSAPHANLPTAGEWNAVKEEVVVKGSSALGCETKMVREWLRISCRGKNDHGGSPVGVSITKGGEGGNAMTFRDKGLVSLVMRFERGTSLEAMFFWTDRSHKLHANWPAGQSAAPQVKAVFEGAASPLDKPAVVDGAPCHKKGDCGPRMECCYGYSPDQPTCAGQCAENSLVVCGTKADCGSGWNCIDVGYPFNICAP